MKSDNGKKGLVFMGMGFELVALILGGQVIGELLDNKYNLNGLGVGGMIILVMIGWFYHLLVMLKPFMEDNETDDDASHN